MNRKVCSLLIMAAVLCLSRVATAQDWLTYMHDNSRSGVTSEALVLGDLKQGWVYRSPAPPQVAWDGGAPWDAYRSSASSIFHLTPQRDFDFVHFVTVHGDSVFFGSSVTDSVHCLDARTGLQKWFFATQGPVRYPPCIFEGKLYFGSDDGYCYCISEDNGQLVWKYFAGESGKLIGNNGSAIPAWPIRTGTSIMDGKVYFAASLVNWKASYLCSLNAIDGVVNGTGTYKVSGGVTPMGSIMVSPTKIYLLQGRRAPQVFSRTSGSKLGEIGSTGNGGSYALLTVDTRFAQGYASAHTADYALREFNADTKDVVASYPDGRRLIVASDKAYILTESKLTAVNRTSGATEWAKDTDCPYCLIKAGDVLFAGGKNKITAYNSVDGSVMWTKAVRGAVRGLAAANGKLYASTDNGWIYMFGKNTVPADLNEDGRVDSKDLGVMAGQYMRNTDPQSGTGEKANNK